MPAQNTVDIDELKQALGSFTTGVTVVTTRDASDRPTGMTASAFSAVSLEPPLVLVCINRENRSYQEIVESGVFGVNILSAEATELSNHCARPGADKILPDAWLSPASHRAPAVADALAYLGCDVHEEFVGGTHAVFLGQVRTLELGVSDADPLVYYRGGYRHLEDSVSLSR